MGVTMPKLEEQWTQEEELASTHNSRAINALYNGLAMFAFRRILTCTTSKEVWNILWTVHEIDTVKQLKLHKLNTTFENIKMEEDKTFNELYAKLNETVHSVFTLGDLIP